jgi:hypothetical protein
MQLRAVAALRQLEDLVEAAEDGLAAGVLSGDEVRARNVPDDVRGDQLGEPVHVPGRERVIDLLEHLDVRVLGHSLILLSPPACSVPGHQPEGIAASDQGGIPDRTD